MRWANRAANCSASDWALLFINMKISLAACTSRVTNTVSKMFMQTVLQLC
jgi:hypothetical protein